MVLVQREQLRTLISVNWPRPYPGRVSPIYKSKEIVISITATKYHKIPLRERISWNILGFLEDDGACVSSLEAGSVLI